MTTTTKHEPLGELYLAALVDDVGVVRTICDAIHEGDPIDAAGKLVRDAMGILEITIGRISRDQWDLPDETDWPRLDAFWELTPLLARDTKKRELLDPTAITHSIDTLRYAVNYCQKPYAVGRGPRVW